MTPRVRVGSVVGRFYAMDRDNRWDRVQHAYDLLVHGARRTTRADAAGAVRGRLRARRDRRVHRADAGRRATAPIRAGRRVFCFNFRPDRMREIMRALADPAFDRVRPGRAAAERRRYTTMTQYEEGFPYPVAFAPERPDHARRGASPRRARQLHVAETEKYPHVTYFFNGGEEQPSRASGVSWCPPSATSRPTTSSRR